MGLPLAAAFARRLPTIGFEIDTGRIQELRRGYDRNAQVGQEALRAPHLQLTSDESSLRRAACIIIAVPTPVDRAKRPDLSLLEKASRLVGRQLSAGVVVVYESTVYPGCTEEFCIPILERESGLKAGRDFCVGYSPERINPGDAEHTLAKVVKVVSAQDAHTLEVLAGLYGLVAEAGIHRAPTIRTAEAAKVIENIQRDLNIALMNELSVLFHRMDIDFREVLKAARTKWNFVPFEPGLVGGHCIPEDPYYLTHKAQEIGYYPEIILAGRRVNESMGVYVAQETVKLLIRAGRTVQGATVLVLGVSFKENVRDTRNTKVVPMVREIEGYGCRVEVYDPVVGEEGVRSLELHPATDPFTAPGRYDAVVLAVPHRMFIQHPQEAFLQLLTNDGKPGVLTDVKAALHWQADGNCRALYWSL